MLVTLINRWVNTGVQAKTDFNLRNKLRVFNSANLIIAAVSVFYIGVGIANGFYIAVIATFYSLFSNVLAFILVSKGYYRIAFHYTFWYAFVFLSAFSVLFGDVNNSYYYFLFLPVACNILFDDNRFTVAYSAIGAGLMVGSVYFVDHCEPYYRLEFWMRYFSYPNIVFAALLIFLGVRLFKQENRRYANEVELRNRQLAEKNREITDSINYAKKIQSALIVPEEEFRKLFPDSIILFRPKDIVSGDFYWQSLKEPYAYYVTADCTGHGVPGGFMTMLGISFLEEIVNDKNVTEPAAILDALRDKLVQTLRQSGNANETKDGMDVTVCRLNRATLELCYAAANNPLFVLREDRLIECRADKQPCGFYHRAVPFTQHAMQLEQGDTLFTFTDGYADQFGGPAGKKFKYRKLERLIVEMRFLPLSEQKTILEREFDAWKGDLEQIDDVCLIAIRV